MTNNKSYVAAPQSGQVWTYAVPSQKNKKMQLLTIGNVCVYGHWYGELGEAFKAWAPLLSTNVVNINEPILNKLKNIRDHFEQFPVRNMTPQAIKAWVELVDLITTLEA